MVLNFTISCCEPFLRRLFKIFICLKLLLGRLPFLIPTFSSENRKYCLCDQNLPITMDTQRLRTILRKENETWLRNWLENWCRSCTGEVFHEGPRSFWNFRLWLRRVVWMKSTHLCLRNSSTLKGWVDHYLPESVCGVSQSWLVAQSSARIGLILASELLMVLTSPFMSGSFPRLFQKLNPGWKLAHCLLAIFLLSLVPERITSTLQQ